MYVQIAAGAALLLSCLAFGGMGDDPGDPRFRIPQSLFYANSNDLALALLLAIASMMFLFHRPSRAWTPGWHRGHSPGFVLHACEPDREAA